MSDFVPDELDRRILDELRADGRRSKFEIAKAVGASEVTVRRRLIIFVRNCQGDIAGESIEGWIPDRRTL
jgi:DNA-binding Lrp family transcriptional regulator